MLSIVGCSSAPSPSSSPGEPASASAAQKTSGAANGEPTRAPEPQAEQAGVGFEAPTFQVVRIAATTEVVVTLRKREGVRPWTGNVSYTAEPLTITGRSRKGKLRERNVLGSGRAIDLDGDGDTRDAFAVRCEGGRVAIADSPEIGAVMGSDATVRTYDYAAGFATPIGTAGGHAMLYLPCGDDGSMTLGLAPEPIEVRTIPGPALMVLAFGDPALAPKVAVDGVSREPSRDDLETQHFEVAAYEQVSDAPRWYAIAGAMVQLDPTASQQEVRVFIEGDVEDVTIAINEGREGVHRARSYVSSQKVGTR